jgi:glucokinase
LQGPTRGDIIRFTNNPWIIRPALIGEKLNVDRYTLVNDFEAVGHAVAQADAGYFERLTGPDEALPVTGTVSVLGPGTGLGVAHIWRDGADYRVQATEGGHIDFAPLDSIEDAILARLRKRHRRVSIERIVSGPGIVDIYETLASMEGRAITPLDDRTIWTNAMSGEDALAAAAADRFCLSLGSVAGDLALAQGASGVVIAGGLGLRIRDQLVRSAFPNASWRRGGSRISWRRCRSSSSPIRSRACSARRLLSRGSIAENSAGAARRKSAARAHVLPPRSRYHRL